MSFDLLKSAKHIKDLSHAEFRVLFYLLESANNKSYRCNPRIKDIAVTCGMGIRTVQRHISAMADRGLFQRIETRRDDGSRSTNEYQFIVSGTIKVGRQEIIQLEPELDETEWTKPEQQPAKNGTLLSDSNRPLVAGGGATVGVTYNRESNQEVITPPCDLFSESSSGALEKPLVDHVMDEWSNLVASHPMIQSIRVMNDSRRRKIIARAAEVVRGTKGISPNQAWTQVLEGVRKSSFLRGDDPPTSKYPRPFSLSIDYLLRPAEFIRTFESADHEPSFNAAEGHHGLGPTDKALRGTLARFRAARSGSGPTGDCGGDRHAAGG